MSKPTLHSDLDQEKPVPAGDLFTFEFLGARARILDLAAFLDRIERHGGNLDDYRGRSLQAALRELATAEPGKTARILELLSDPTTEPIDKSPGKSASGAWEKFGSP